MTNKKIESHSSNLNNKRIQILLLEVDKNALAAGSSMDFTIITQYWNSIEQLYINVKDVFHDKGEVINQIAKNRKYYYKLLDLITLDGNCRTEYALHILLRTCRKFNSNVITALQGHLEYFFRTGTRDVKGLLKIPFYETPEGDFEEDEDDEIGED